jgi:hypothetical protein
MARLEDLKAGASIRGLAPGGLAKVVQIEWFGDRAVKVTFEDSAAQVRNRLVFRTEEPTLEVVEEGRPWSFDGDGHLLRLVSEAYRIRLAHLFDPYLAIHTSRIEPLPHQITGVYGEMLPRQPLRFLLADDPGAGKTIMAGLFIKELDLGGVCARAAVPPAAFPARAGFRGGERDVQARRTPRPSTSAILTTDADLERPHSQSPGSISGSERSRDHRSANGARWG